MRTSSCNEQPFNVRFLTVISVRETMAAWSQAEFLEAGIHAVAFIESNRWTGPVG